MDKKISKDNLLEFRDFIQTRTGLFFPESKFFSIESIIQTNFDESPVSTFEDYISYLSSISGKSYLNRLVSLLTTNETYFFRGKAHFNLLEKNILPEIIENEASKSHAISIWSAGCSTGEEPYSIAILLKKILPKISTWDINIVGTDIDESALKSAQRGLYSDWSFRGVDHKIVQDCFDKKNDLYLIKNEYKSLVKFSNYNLISDLPTTPLNLMNKFDIIICRNVTIYFEKKTTQMLAKKFHHLLKDDGYLIVGHAEHSAENFSLFHSRAFPDAIIYQKKRKNSRTQEHQAPLYVPKKIIVEKQADDQAGTYLSSMEKRGSNKTTSNLLDLIKEDGKSDAVPSIPVSYFRQRKTASEESEIFNEALQAFFKKNYELAIDRFLRVIHINQDNARACWMLAHIASNRGDFEEALAWSGRSIKIDPLFKEPYYTRSIIYLARGALDEAMETIKKAIYIDQNFILGHFVMGNIYGLMKRLTLREKCFNVVRELLASKPSDEVIFEIENLTVGSLIGSLECKARET